jgi:hypothetical protein
VSKGLTNGRMGHRIIAVGIALGLMASMGSVAQASDPIVLDGEFEDWAGEGWVDDLTGDARSDRTDITRAWWADNDDEESAYWRIDRLPDTRSASYIIGVDADNDGAVSSSTDRLVTVYYNPQTSGSVVHVSVNAADSAAHLWGPIVTDSGESDEDGGRSVEVSVPFSVLGINARQPARFYVWSERGLLVDRVPNYGDVQWTPVDVLGKVILGLAFVIGLGVIWRKRGRTAWAR